MSKLVLDVGCGSGKYQDNEGIKFRGYINCDILRPKHFIPNFVLCDCNYLPFINDCFKSVFFMEVLEHVSSFNVLLELNRVCYDLITLATPNAIYFKKVLRCFVKGNYKIHYDHDKTFGIPELRNLFNKYGFKKYSIICSTYRHKEPLIYRIIRGFFPYSMKYRSIVMRLNVK